MTLPLDLLQQASDSLEADENDLVCKDRLAHLLYDYGMVSKYLFLSNL